MMKKTLLAIALAATALGASAQSYYGIPDHVATTYETDNYGRQVRVVTTTHCTDVRRARGRLVCVEREITEQRYFEGDGYRGYNPPQRAYIDPFIGGFILNGGRDFRGNWDRGNRGEHRGNWDRHDNRGNEQHGNDHHGRDHH